MSNEHSFEIYTSIERNYTIDGWMKEKNEHIQNAQTQDIQRIFDEILESIVKNEHSVSIIYKTQKIKKNIHIRKNKEK